MKPTFLAAALPAALSHTAQADYGGPTPVTDVLPEPEVAFPSLIDRWCMETCPDLRTVEPSPTNDASAGCGDQGLETSGATRARCGVPVFSPDLGQLVLPERFAPDPFHARPDFRTVETQ